MNSERKQFNMDIGDKIKHIRELRQMSTTELAKTSGLSQSYISALENKVRKSPTIDKVEALSKALRVETDYFLKEDFATPFDILTEVPSELKSFMLDLENMPYMKLSKIAKEQGITPEMLDSLLKTLAQVAKNKK